MLERRDLLSAAPTVVAVEVASTSWSETFVDYLQTSGQGEEGYSIPKGSSAQSASLTWTNLDQIKIKFSKDVIIDSADLSLSGVNTTAYGFSNFHYDPQTRFATWTLSSPLDKDRLRLDLDAGGADPVRDLDENTLDGEWTNNVSTVSGNGTAGGDFQFNFNVLPTDVNNSANITSYDYIYIRQLEGKSTTSPGYIAKRDIDGSGLIDSTDWQEAIDRYFETLPTGSPAGTSNDAPTTSGFELVQISDASVDVAISLSSNFGDAESGGSGLTYSILSNSNSSLFDTASVNQSSQELVLNAASGVSGRATIIVRATDAGGLFVDTPITVDVDRENQAPVISNYFISYAGAGTWIVEGDVTDPDDDVSDFIVQFFNVFVTRSAVDENGHFEFAIILDENEWGFEYAVTFDPHGLQSNTDSCEVGLT
ncbi:MAG: hypothetical protein WD468_04730 [Pirellulales bacterium]